MSAVSLFVVVLLVWTGAARATEPNLPFMVYLDSDQLVSLKWGFDEMKENITLELTVNSTGWVGFGFSPNEGMDDADIVMGGVRPSGPYFKDYYATGEIMPVVDKEQSYSLLSMTESDGQTKMRVQRPLDTCDAQDFRISDQPIQIIYAYGTTDDIKYHQKNRGHKKVNLLNNSAKSSLPNAKYISIKMNDISIPQNLTYCHCKVAKLFNFEKKHHVYKIGAEINNTDIVHHVVLYHCPSLVTQPFDGPCDTGNTSTCLTVVASWGLGGEMYELPEHVGIPIGGANSEAFYRLEIHYINPKRKADIKDRSGFKLYYTDQLRKYDAGILSLGVVPMSHMEYKIPPNVPQFQMFSVCNTSYFSKYVNPVPELKVFSVLFHTNLAGRKVRVGHFRDREQIDFLGFDEEHFSAQQLKNLAPIKTIHQGDEIIVECSYNTSDRAEATKFGLSPTDEMCLALLLYYPAIDISSCFSHPNSTHLSNMTDQTSDVKNYETLLKTAPQTQYIADAGNSSLVFFDGFIRGLLRTPVTVCKDTNAASGVFTYWVEKSGAIMLLLLWVVIM